MQLAVFLFPCPSGFGPPHSIDFKSPVTNNQILCCAECGFTEDVNVRTVTVQMQGENVGREACLLEGSFGIIEGAPTLG